MPKSSTTNPVLDRLTSLALALPEAKRELCNSHASFCVRKKTFAYFLDNHHGDGIVAVTCKVLSGENTALTNAQPKRYYLSAYIGPRGWVALRLDLPKIDWSEVRDLLLTSYLLAAPKKLAELVQARD
jgi:phosphoribosylglycinamide formyltransferase-1